MLALLMFGVMTAASIMCRYAHPLDLVPIVDLNQVCNVKRHSVLPSLQTATSCQCIHISHLKA